MYTGYRQFQVAGRSLTIIMYSQHIRTLPALRHTQSGGEKEAEDVDRGHGWS